MNDTQLLERLASAYATIEAPTPSPALAEILESGEIGGGADDEQRGAVVVPLVRPQTHPRVRARHLVAAAVATFVLFSGLAVAGALPDAVQREVSSVVGHLGIDLPSPASGSPDVRSDVPGAPDAPGVPDRPHATSTSSPAAGAAGSLDAPGSGSTAPGTPTTTVPTAAGLGDVGAVLGGGTTVTTVPPSGDGLLPPLTVPEVTIPPVTVPQLPPVTVPQLPLPLPLPLQPLPIPGL